MRILLSGASGLVGSELTRRLRAAGHSVIRLSRHETRRTEDGQVVAVHWDPASGRFDAAAADGCDAVVHLAGENVAGGRWTDARRRAIEHSRVAGTRLLADGLGGLAAPPRLWIGASASGYYGDRGDAVLDERSARGSGFLPQTCESWEQASAGVEQWPARRVLLRIGMVLNPAGGALRKMLPFFKLGVGGRLGSGEQWMCWITLDDLCGIIERALSDERMQGVYNAVSPRPCTNAEFTRALGRAVHRPAVLPVPAFGLRLLYGRMADALLLCSQRVVPRRLEALDHRFADTEIGPALQRVLG